MLSLQLKPIQLNNNQNQNQPTTDHQQQAHEQQQQQQQQQLLLTTVFHSSNRRTNEQRQASGMVQPSCVSVTTSTSLRSSSSPHHHLSLDQQSHFDHPKSSNNSLNFSPLSPKNSSQSLPHWNQLDNSAEMVRHTTKLLKSRDSRTGRLIINQYMKGNELGRGVHGIVYIGKNMDKLIRTSTPQTNDSFLNHPIEPLPEELDHHPHNNQSADRDRQPPPRTTSSWTEEDYETVAIKVVRREPKGPKSLRRSQMQRQQQREAAAQAGLGYLSDSAPILAGGDLLHPHPATLIGRVPLLKDVDDKLKKEIAIMKRLRHKHIVQLKEVIDDAKSKKVFMILEFMEGGQVLWQDPLTHTPLMTVEQARNTFRQVLLGLEYLHYQGIIHRDIKPANLLWTADRETVKISDFGVSHISGVLKRSASNCNLPASIVPSDGLADDSPRTFNSTDDKALRKTEGSPAFMAPELCCPVEATPGITPPEASAVDYFTQRRSSTLTKTTNSSDSSNSPPKEIIPMANSARLISLPLPIKTFARGERPVVGKAIDIWALGVTLYCLLFGRTPFNAPNEYELFNVIWNEPILVPETMGIERQSLEFDPTNRSLDGPVQRDSRELIDLLRKLLEKDPRKRIKLEDVKVHPWVLNNLDNTQHWVHETAPVGGDAVYVTTEEVANFSRPRASLTTHKPLFGVKQSLRKAAIKLGLQRPANKMSRMRSKSVSSGASGSPSPQVETAFSILNPSHSPLSSNSQVRQKISIDTANLSSGNHPRPETPPITPLSFPLSTTNSIKRGFGVCSGWTSAITPKATILQPTSSCQNGALPQPGSPVYSTTHRTTGTASRPQTPIRLDPSRSCLSSVSSRSGSPSQANIGPSHPSTLSVPRSSSPSTFLLSHHLDRSIHAHHPHMLLDPISFPVDKNNHRRSLPSSPAPLHALTSLSRTSLIPPRTASPAGTSDAEFQTRLAPPPTWFRDALFRVKRRFTRSPHRRNSHLTDLSASDDLDRTPIQGRAPSTGPPATASREFFDHLKSHRPPSEVFSSDAEPSISLDHSQRPDNATHDQEGVEVEDDDDDGEEHDADEEDDEDEEEIGSEGLGKPLMYHDGTQWTFPATESNGVEQARNDPGTEGARDWLQQILVPRDEVLSHQARRNRATGEDEVAGDLDELRLDASADQLSSPSSNHQHHHLLLVPSTSAATATPIISSSSSPSPSPWTTQPRLTFRPASVDHDHSALEYRSFSSDDDDDDDDDDGINRQAQAWKPQPSSSSSSSTSSSSSFSRNIRHPPFSSNCISSTSTTTSTTTTTTNNEFDSDLHLLNDPHHPINHPQHLPFIPHLNPTPPAALPSAPPPITLAQEEPPTLDDLDPRQQRGGRDDEEEEDDEEADNTLQIQVKPRKRGCSRSEGS
ncbi:hypothetical protein PGT21_011124 [Puccinia graminis f. sp. tritici]|uniref:Protein kinase domain-containing protein n=2 Tax=Puccinia graminis f. sp. tritici TaxID=56615 RepID=A0A5B0NFN1_PUCGR|nr:hypothetical protein PGT21_011124 [Puccinia graminis f. sp. tritici]